MKERGRGLLVSEYFQRHQVASNIRWVHLSISNVLNSSIKLERVLLLDLPPPPPPLLPYFETNGSSRFVSFKNNFFNLNNQLSSRLEKNFSLSVSLPLSQVFHEDNQRRERSVSISYLICSTRHGRESRGCLKWLRLHGGRTQPHQYY